MQLAPTTNILTRTQFHAQIAELCGWTEIYDNLRDGVPPSGGGRLPIPKCSQNLQIAWEILRHVEREGGDAFEKMHQLLTAENWWSLDPASAAEFLCRAFCVARLGIDVEIDDPVKDWDD
jgi:hypothetical protein